MPKEQFDTEDLEHEHGPDPEGTPVGLGRNAWTVVDPGDDAIETTEKEVAADA